MLQSRHASVSAVRGRLARFSCFLFGGTPGTKTFGRDACVPGTALPVVTVKPVEPWDHSAYRSYLLPEL